MSTRRTTTTHTPRNEVAPVERAEIAREAEAVEVIGLMIHVIGVMCLDLAGVWIVGRIALAMSTVQTLEDREEVRRPSLESTFKEW